MHPFTFEKFQITHATGNDIGLWDRRNGTALRNQRRRVQLRCRRITGSVERSRFVLSGCCATRPDRARSLLRTNFSAGSPLFFECVCDVCSDGCFQLEIGSVSVFLWSWSVMNILMYRSYLMIYCNDIFFLSITITQF